MRQTLAEATPRPARLVQRGIVNVTGRQFSCDGLVQVAADGRLRLALLTPMGVITELRVGAEGTTEILKTAPRFREQWARDQVAATARLLFPANVALLTKVPGPILTGGGRTYFFSADGTQWLGAQAGGLRATCHGEVWHVKSPAFELELRTVKR